MYSQCDEKAEKMHYWSQRKIKVMVVGQESCVNIVKVEGTSINTVLFALKVIEIEKDDNCTLSPFPSSTDFSVLHNSFHVKFHPLISTTTSIRNGKKDN